ncbi:MAG: beta-lactamase family protein [Proteobacteria bacterium]|nr:beta-lactamase family protein [Pseudomonadota bacterium]
MVKLTNIITTVLLLFITSFDALAQADTTREAAINKALPRFEKSIQDMMKSNGIPGVAVAVVSKDKVYYLKTFGVKRVGNPEKINPSTLFQIASLSKPINATMLAILRDKGKVSFDDPVSDHIPHFQASKNKQPLKICHLMSHSTGIPKGGFDDMIEAQKPREQIINKLESARRVAAPGKQFAYHNATYGVVEDVITSASKKSLPQTLKEELFMPLGMKHICVGYQPLLDAPDRAYPHVPSRKGKYVPAPQYSKAYYAFLAAGGINASIQDLVPFLQLYLGKPSSIVSKQTLTQLTSPFVKNTKAVMLSEAPKGKVKDTYYGLGWHSMNYAHQKVIYHQGHLKGFRNFMGFLPDDVGIIILTNADRKHASKIAMKFFDYYMSA